MLYTTEYQYSRKTKKKKHNKAERATQPINTYINTYE